MNKVTKKKAIAVVGVMALLCSCGDEITEITNTGMSSVVAYEDLAKCEDKNEGELVFVKDSSAVYLCSDKKWNDINGNDGKNGKEGANGSDGKDGKNGTNGSNGKDGTSCTVEPLKDGSGYNVLCGDKVVGKLLNGEKGDNGKNGNDGKSCTVKENDKKNGYDLVCGDETVTITNGKDGESITGPKGESCTGAVLENGNIQINCGNKTIGELKNGTDGKSAFELAQEKDETITDIDEWLASLKGEPGQGCTAKEIEGGVEITCDGKTVTVKNGKDGQSSMAVCGKESYDPETHFCYNNERYLLCNGKVYNPEKELCHNKLIYGSCGELYFDPSKQYCYSQEIYDLEECGKNTYKPKMQLCDEREGGVVYNIVTIEPKGTTYSKTWMAENLNYKVENSYCYKSKTENEAPEDCKDKGRLYSWAAAVNKAEDECGLGHSCELEKDLNGNIKGICPDGWHLPSKGEWDDLVKALSDVSSSVGSLLKSRTGWDDYGDDSDGNGFDSYGFAGYPVGYGVLYKTDTGEEIRFDYEGLYVDFVSSTQGSKDALYGLYLGNTYTDAKTTWISKENYCSIRCVKD